MSDAPPRTFISVKFAPVGRTHTFLLPDLALDAEPRSETDPSLNPGDSVVVQTTEGPAFGTTLPCRLRIARRLALGAVE